MTFKVGDMVRADAGIEGEIFLMDAHRRSAMVKLHDDGPGVRIVSTTLDQLARIEVHSAAPSFNGRPAHRPR